MQHATPHSSSPTTTSKFFPGHPFPLDFQGRVENPYKCAWVVSGAPAGVAGYPSASDSQPEPVHALKDAEQLLILEEDTPPTDVRVPQLQNTLGLNIFLGEKSVEIMNFERESIAKWNLTNLIFLRILEHQFIIYFSSKINQICVSFFEQHSILVFSEFLERLYSQHVPVASHHVSESHII